MEQGEVKFIRLITGEDIITEIRPQDNNYILVKPLKIVYAFGDKPGVISIGLVQWLFPEIVDTQEIPIKLADIMTIAEPTVQMEINYWESLERLDKNVSFEFTRGSVTQEDSAFIDDTEEIDEDLIKDMLESMKKVDRRKLH